MVTDRMNGEHFSDELEISEATGKKTRNINLLFNSLGAIPPTFAAWELNTTEQFQYWTSLFFGIILEKCLLSIAVYYQLKDKMFIFIPQIAQWKKNGFILYILRYSAWGKNKLLFILINDNRAVIKFYFRKLEVI